MMVTTLGVLTSIPRDLEEAARIDGATWWQRFRHVVWPQLAPGLLPAVVLGSVWTFNLFNVVYLVSQGEPNSTTEILVSEAYRWAFTRATGTATPPRTPCWCSRCCSGSAGSPTGCWPALEVPR
jgi:arabinogalactan oligomer/maltooligosaccharide transport system permease protein